MTSHACYMVRRLAIRTLLLTVVAVTGVSTATADWVTVWEDQFTSISPDWGMEEGVEFVSQPVPEGIVSEDGFELRYTTFLGTASWIRRTIPAHLVRPGDKVEYAVRTQYPHEYAGDRLNLVAEVGDAYDSGFVAHDSAGGLEYKMEPGTLFDDFDTTLQQGLRAEDNLWLGNNGWGGVGVASTIYIDYIRIIGERTISPGDYNGDGSVDAADYTVWRDTLGQTVASGTGADGDGNGTIEDADYDLWKLNYGGGGGSGASTAVVPEPLSATLLLTALLGLAVRRQR
jgi:hypothetical protein